MPAVNTGRTNPEATPGQWVQSRQDDPVETPDIAPLWLPEPDPPVIDRQPEPPFGQPPGAWQGAGQTATRDPNDRHPVTGAPVWNPDKPPGPLPPGRISVQPDGTHPVTGAPIVMPPPVSPLTVPQMGSGWEPAGEAASAPPPPATQVREPEPAAAAAAPEPAPAEPPPAAPPRRPGQRLRRPR